MPELNINDIFSNFSQEQVVTIDALDGGHIQKTYKIETSRNKYILQQINSMYGEGTTSNIFWITSFLRKNRQPTFEVLASKQRKYTFEVDGRYWRCLSYIKGANFAEVTHSNIAFQAGAGLGRFLQTMAGFKDYLKIVGADFIPRAGIHAPQKHLELLAQASDAEKEPDIRFLRDLIIRNMESNLLPTTIRKTLTHSDPKIQNFVFVGTYPSPAAIIDLDDVGYNLSPLYDIGDAFRSWCCQAFDQEHAYLNLYNLKAGWQGFLSQAPNFLNEEELFLIPQAVCLMSLELASRFLRDCYEDYFFSWNNSLYGSRKEHNLARAKRFYTLFESALDRKGEVLEIISKKASQAT